MAQRGAHVIRHPESTDTPALTITLIGVGLIGGSWMLDLKRVGRVGQVIGVDRNRDNLQRALERRVIDVVADGLAQACAQSDVVVLAVPVAAMPEVVRSLMPYWRRGMVLTDVGSTKRQVLEDLRPLLGTFWPDFVAAHPIAGSDRSGALAARFDLFNAKNCILCPHEQQNPAALALIESLWHSVGAHTCRMSAVQHDEILAAVSHLPHVLAYAYMHQVAGSAERDNWLAMAGSGFRDFTRIAASHPQMWADICLANRDHLLTLLQAHLQELAALQAALNAADGAELKRYFAQAQVVREAWQARG